MIITVTLNPALDKTVAIETLKPGGLNRITSTTVDAGGKGINVSKMAKVLGIETLATGFCGGSGGRELVSRLDDLNIKHDFVMVQSNTRTNTKVLDKSFGITELNEAGVVVTEQEQQSLIEKLLSFAKSDAIFVLSGSTHANAPRDFYKQLIKELKNKGSFVLFDADGEQFKQAISEYPNFIKPNDQELIEFCNKKDMTKQEMYTVCRQLIKDGVEFVALSQGKDGAAFITKTEAYYSPPIDVVVASTVGAGDSMVAAVACAKQLGLSLEQTAKLAMACSAGAVTTSGTNPPTKELVEQLKQSVKLETITF